mgnify:FL=1
MADDIKKELLNNQPYAITGNSFYNLIEGLICEECHKESIYCKCPKTEAEAKKIAKETNEKQKPIKKN